jgi:phytanoyl-CoA hydroxylase
MFRIEGPDGRPIEIPFSVVRKTDPYPPFEDIKRIRQYYEQEGYVVVRELLPAEFCDAAREAFAAEVKPYRGFIYRQASANPENHIFSAHGYMLNSILNIQDLPSSCMGNFRGKGLALLTHHRLQKIVSVILGEPGKLVQSMYFEGNPVTWPHQDTYYLDAAEIGRMTAVWVAVEDIRPGAGRFFVYPGSHKIEMPRNGKDFDIAFHHDRYKSLVRDVIREHKLECRAPALNKGDALFWSSKTIHGSLQTTQSEFTRSSFTAHFIPESMEFLQWQTRIKPLKLKDIHGVKVHCAKDQNEWNNRLVMWVETRFPSVFQTLKKLVIKLLTR